MYKSEFEAFCKKNKLSYDMFDFHFTDVKSVKRYKTKKRKDTSARFLILAINELKIFAIWDLNDVVVPNREIYSVEKSQVLVWMENKSLSKAIEYPNRGMEKVYIIPINMLSGFMRSIS